MDFGILFVETENDYNPMVDTMFSDMLKSTEYRQDNCRKKEHRMKYSSIKRESRYSVTQEGF